MKGALHLNYFRSFRSYALIGLFYCIGILAFLGSYTTVQAQANNTTQKLAASPQAHALWAALHKKLSDLGERQAEHDKLPKSSFNPFKKSQKKSKSLSTKKRALQRDNCMTEPSPKTAC